MNLELENRIKKAYPTGLIEELNDAMLRSEGRDERLQCVLTLADTGCHLACQQDNTSLFYSFAFTQKEHPRFEVWVSQMRNPEKLAWIKANGQPYPVLWVNISRVADWYYFYYNHWTPRGETGFLDADWKRSPSALWHHYEKTIRNELALRGFDFLSSELAAEKTPFVLKRDYDSIEDTDPRWSDPEFEPPLTPATIHHCLFGDWG